jgi:hypothetical protein
MDTLRSRFVLRHTRRVSADNVVSVGNTRYEVPLGHARTRIDVYRNTLDGTVSCIHEGREQVLHPVSLAENAASRRGKRGRGRASTREKDPPVAASTAATRAFGKAYAPVVDEQGGLLRAPASDGGRD